MAAWLASHAVLPAPVAAKQVRASTALGSPAVEDRMAALAERIDGLKLAGAKAVRVAGLRAVSLDWVEGRGGFHYSPRSPTGVRSRFPQFFHGRRGGFRRQRGHYWLRR
jgi:hypothetical protein